MTRGNSAAHACAKLGGSRLGDVANEMAVIRTERRNQLCLCFAALAAASLLSTVGIIFSGRLGNPTKELREGSTPIPTLNLFADRLSFTEYRQPRALETRRSQTIRSFMSTSVGFHMPLDPNATTIEVNANRLVPTGATNETTPKTSSQCKLQNCMDNKDKLPTPVDFQTPIHPRSNTTKVNASRLVPTGSPPPTNSSKTSPQCKQQNCLDFLSTRDKQEHSKCLSETRKYFKKDTDIKPSSCNFLPDRSRRAVALASPEGSGNTWLRELLETATGVCTGFCCCDPELRVLGFPGEGITSGSVLVVKTHIGSPQWFGAKKVLQWEGSYGSAVFLVRNPARALIAEWNRRATNNLKRERHKRSHGNSNRARLDSHTYAVSEEEFSMYTHLHIHSSLSTVTFNCA